MHSICVLARVWAKTAGFRRSSLDVQKSILELCDVYFFPENPSKSSNDPSLHGYMVTTSFRSVDGLPLGGKVLGVGSRCACRRSCKV